MSLKGGGLRGAQEPRVRVAPRAKWSEADDAAFLSSSYGLTPDPWQFFVLEDWLARRADGKWASGRCGLSVPRQNGKNGIIEVRELFGMIVLGEKFLHTAHEVKTARKAFLRLKHFFGKEANDPRARFPELNALVEEVRSTNGQEAIILRNGGSVEFVARSRGSARGFTVDVLVLDEAQELTDEQLEALQPTISSAPRGNPQTIMTGTPPAAFSRGTVFTRTRKGALDGKARRLCWHEWSVTGDVDIFDPAVWAQTNPALGIRLQRTVIEDELPPGMSVDGFARERLGRWLDELTQAGPFPAGTWSAGVTTDTAVPAGARVVYSVDVSMDRAMSYIGVAYRHADGLPVVAVYRQRAGVEWVAPWFKDRADPDGPPIDVWVQGRGAPASSLIEELRAIDGVEVHELGGPDLPNATAKLFDAVKGSGLIEQDDGTPPRREGLRHLPQPVLDVAAASAVPKILDGGGMTWDRKRSPVDVAPLMAVTEALWGLLTLPAEFRSVYEDERLVIA